MKTALIISLLIISFTLTAGCESMGVTVTYDDQPTRVPTLSENVTPNVTAMQTQRVITNATRPVPRNTTVPTTEPTPEETIEEPEPVRTKEVPDVANTSQPYSVYTDSDFSISFPSNWSVSKSSMNTPRSPYVIDGSLKPDTRTCLFEGRNKSVNFTAQVSDFMQPGLAKFPPDLIEAAGKTVEYRFNDVAGRGTITNNAQKFTAEFLTPYVTFDVTIPAHAAVYPYTYTERNLISYSHLYTFRFNTPGDLDQYKEIKRVIFDSIKTEEKVKRV